jgi:hypothetical protein
MLTSTQIVKSPVSSSVGHASRPCQSHGEDKGPDCFFNFFLGSCLRTRRTRFLFLYFLGSCL